MKGNEWWEERKQEKTENIQSEKGILKRQSQTEGNNLMEIQELTKA
ncbi:MAG: hypothetical protein HFI78_00185 [Lachnospiraceae bacterium]|jgi:hypothetical protein|nr:hypothetical protein [Lachnospiraceae bacterium]